MRYGVSAFVDPLGREPMSLADACPECVEQTTKGPQDDPHPGLQVLEARDVN
jgi:hypothetical protein